MIKPNLNNQRPAIWYGQAFSHRGHQVVNLRPVDFAETGQAGPAEQVSSDLEHQPAIRHIQLCGLLNTFRGGGSQHELAEGIVAESDFGDVGVAAVVAREERLKHSI